jgi:hypothetical protein
VHVSVGPRGPAEACTRFSPVLEPVADGSRPLTDQIDAVVNDGMEQPGR